MQFLYQGLAWGFLLTLVPVLIHLINMMRHRRVKWAAMEFLLQSYKKHRKWVWLKQLLLLAARMLAVALIVAMLAQWITRGQWLDLLGGKVTHHYVLLDDSGSMGEQYGAATAFEMGSRFLQRLSVQAAEQQMPQQFTLIRFSRANQGEAADSPHELADLNSELVDSEFPQLVEQKRNSFAVTQLPVTSRPALELVRQLMDEAPDENRILYIVSDFRTHQWENPAEVRQSLAEFEKAGAKIHLVKCSGTQRPNLGIVDVQPADETRAAEVPLFVNVRVKNFSGEPAENVQVKIRTWFHDPDALATGDAEAPVAVREELPILLIERIEPGQTVSERVQVYFPKSGSHVVEAELPEDALAEDNRRWCVVDFPESEPVLIVDGDPAQRNAFFLQSIFEPGQRARTGVAPTVETPAYLRDTPANQLAKYRMMFLCDVPRLDQSAVEHLETYVRQGGGVAFFLGDQVNLAAYNRELYRDGQGIFPIPLDRDDALLSVEEIDPPPDIDMEGSSHPVFRELISGRNPLIRMVRVERYLRPSADWLPDPDSTVEVIARYRNRQPMAIERQFGQGRVIVFTTTFGPYWNDLVLGPNVLLALRLQSYLAAPLRTVEDQPVGTPIRIELPADEYQPAVRFFVPDRSGEGVEIVDRTAEKPEPPAGQLVASISGRETAYSGVYEAWMRNNQGQLKTRRVGVNVDPVESDLQVAQSRDVLAKLLPVKAELRDADEYDAAVVSAGGFNRGLLLMCILLALLLGEQWLAYSASYHPVPGVSR